jgi:NAD(P)H-hydrate epimerase
MTHPTRILTAEQMRAADRHAIETLGIPSLVLMENAGREVVRAMEAAFPRLLHASVLVLCGRGNNGGDGLVIARHLAARGVAVRAALVAEPSQLSGDCEAQWRILRHLALPCFTVGPKGWAELRDELDEVDLVVDALLGTGFRGPLEGLLAEIVEDLNAANVPVVAVDVPSGLSGDAAAVTGPAVEATLTVTFAAPKVCHVFAPAAELCGELVVADIGIPESSLLESGSELLLVDDEMAHEHVGPLGRRPLGSHKGTWGHVVVVGGSTGKTGAPALAALGALTAGAGLVTVATPAPCVASVAAHVPELMQVALPSTDAGEIADGVQPVDDVLLRATVLVIGPGLGTGPGARRLLAALLDAAHVPVVLDADALNLLALGDGAPAHRADRPLVLTPHPGELARLLGRAGAGRAETQHDRIEDGRRYAREAGLVLVVKGHRTFTTWGEAPAHVSSTGNPGMATAGTGDVLSGVIGGLLAQGVAAPAAAWCGVHLHGRAGDLAEGEVGQMALRATDILRLWPAAVRSLAATDERAR